MKHYFDLKCINLPFPWVDRGGLNMPSKEFVQRMWTIYRFVEFAVKKLQNTRKTREDLISFLTPHITGCSTFCCTRAKEMPAGNKHNEQLAILILCKFINPMIMDTQQHNLICRQRPLLLAIIKLSTGNLIHIPNNNIYFWLPLLTEEFTASRSLLYAPKKIRVYLFHLL